MTGTHATLGLAMLPVIGFSPTTGLIMKKQAQARKAACLLPGPVGLCLATMACIQFFGGLEIIRDFVQGV